MRIFRNIGAAAVAATVTLALVKLVLALVVPLLGMLIGLMAVAFKIGLWAVLGFIAYRMIQAYRRRQAHHTSPH